MLMPKRTKFRKQQKGQFAGLSKGATFVDFGEFGMQTLERGWITSRQIEACRVAINRYLKRKGKVWIRVFPDKSVTKKPAETRMGKAVKIYRLVKTMKRARALKENAQHMLALNATSMRTAFMKLKGMVAIRALDQVEKGYRTLRNKMITSFVANALITMAFGALLASAIIAAFFFGAASVGLMAAFFGCLGGGLGALAIGVLVGIVSAVCQRSYKRDAARHIQSGVLYALILEQMQRFPKEFLRDAVSKSVVALQAGEALDAGEFDWTEMPSITACLGREGADAQAYSFISASPMDACVEETPY